MAVEKKRFADDGWAVWVDGDDTSVVYINDWLDPKRSSYVDIAVRICGIKTNRMLYVYVPFPVYENEIEDVSLMFDDRNILQAIFSCACIVDYMKNEYTSEIAYSGKTVDIVHVSKLKINHTQLQDGVLLSIDLEMLWPYLANDEAYFIWRMPHKSLDRIFGPRVDMKNILVRFRDLVMSPVVSEKFGYSVRINESRLLPEEINRIGAFHRQKLIKAVISISIHEDYEINDGGCYRIRRLEERLYRNYLPRGFDSDDVITYQWNQTREHNLLGHFNFYYNISHNAISSGSMFAYMVILLAVGVLGEFLADGLRLLIDLLF